MVLFLKPINQGLHNMVLLILILSIIRHLGVNASSMRDNRKLNMSCSTYDMYRLFEYVLSQTTVLILHLLIMCTRFI